MELFELSLETALEPRIAVQLLHPAALLPRYGHVGPFGDLAADLHAVEAHTIVAGETVAIPTGIALGFPAGYGGLIADRSSLALRGLHALAGLIDPGYRGEVKVIVHNLSAGSLKLEAGARIAQIRVVPLLQARFEAVASVDEALNETVRGVRGFGSTGI